MIFIKTDRLILRNYRPEDFSDYYEYMCLPYTAQEEDFEPFTLKQCREAVNERLNDDSFIAAELKENHKMIGDLCFRRQVYEAFEIAYEILMLHTQTRAMPPKPAKPLWITFLLFWMRAA
ncbi:GNAT family N-acetyltransferase [Eisenbergiella sp.]